MILPGKYSQLHSNSVEPAQSYDVRENLKTFHREENTDEYCVVFRVEKAMKSCKFNEDTKKIVRGKLEGPIKVNIIIYKHFSPFVSPGKKDLDI